MSWQPEILKEIKMFLKTWKGNFHRTVEQSLAVIGPVMSKLKTDMFDPYLYDAYNFMTIAKGKHEHLVLKSQKKQKKEKKNKQPKNNSQ